MRTSITHPLTIDAMPCATGRIGMTHCPGKKATSLFGSPWERDLAADMRAIVEWGAGAVVSLTEGHEFRTLGVPGLGDAVESAGLDWYHLPIEDVNVPDESFERLWTWSGHVLRRKLRAGESVLLHCRGGLGRTGTIAARLAIESGTAPEKALRIVRAARPGAVETSGQQAYVLNQRRRPEEDTCADRVLGCLLGGAVGDAFGYAVEFASLSAIRQRFGPRGLRQPVFDDAGELVVSDDTQMTLFTGEGLLRSTAGGEPIDPAGLLAWVRAATVDWYSMQMGGPIVGNEVCGLSKQEVVGFV